MEFQIDARYAQAFCGECEQGHVFFSSPTLMELQIDTESLQGQDCIKTRTHMEPQIDSVHEGKKLSKFPHTWNYKLTGNVHKGGMIPNSPWNFKLTGKVHKGKVISIFPPPRNYKLTGNVHRG